MTFLPMVSVALISQEPARGLGKFKWEPVYHGDSVRKSGIHAKTHDLRQVWGNSQRKPFMMAIAKKRVIRLAKPFGSVKPCGLAK